MFVSLPVLAIIAVVVVGALFLAFRPRRASNDLMAPPRAAVPHTVYKTLAVGTLTPEAEERVAGLVRGGEIIQAIVVVREETGLGLAAAKAVVDKMR